MRIVLCWLIAILLMGTGVADAAPSSDLWKRWTAHDPESTATIDHAAWTRWLERYRRVDPDGIARLDYAGIDTDGRRWLDDYVDRLADVEIDRYRRTVQRAYWINLYNALTVRVVLDHYPVGSIRDIDISPGLFARGPWGAKLVTVEGTGLSLDDIEHRILRPIWKDPRVHYAVNCAAVGCPNLRAVAFTAGNTEELLEHGARDYVNDERGVAFVDGELVVSSIYHWFQADFGGSQAGVIAHLRRFAKPPLADRLRSRDTYGDYRYDWSLNDTQ